MKWISFLNPRRLSWPVIALLLVMTVIYAATLPPIGSYFNDSDMYSTYALAAIDALEPGFLARDYFFGTGDFFAAMPRLYDLALRGLTVAAGDPLRAWEQLWALLVITYVPLMFVLLFRVSGHWPAALLVTWLSVGQARLTVTGTFWGISPHILPLVMYAALFPLALLLAWRWFVLRRDGAPAPTGWQALILGLLLGLSNEVHPVSAIGGAELVGLWLLWQIATRRAAAHTLLWYGLGLLPGFWPRLAGIFDAGGGAINAGFIRERIVLFGSSYGMLFPWQSEGGTPGLPAASFLHVEGVGPILLVVGGYVLLTLFSGTGAWLARRQGWPYARLWLAAFVLAQAAWTPFVLRFGLAWAVLGVYWCWRLYDNDLQRADWALLALWVISLWLGVIQQIALLGLWEVTGITTVALVAYETARLGCFAYPVVYLILGCALPRLTRPIGQRWVRGAVMLLLALLLAQNQSEFVAPQAPQLALLLLLGVLSLWPLWERHVGWPWKVRAYGYAGLVALLVSGLAWLGLLALGIDVRRAPLLLGAAAGLAVLMVQPGVARIGRGLLAAGGTLAVGAALLLSVTLPDGTTAALLRALANAPYDRAASAPPQDSAVRPVFEDVDYFQPDYRDVMLWIRDHTPPGSLIYTNDSVGFRAMTHRPLTHSGLDVGIALYSGHQPETVAQRDEAYKAALATPETLLQQAAEADYFILPADIPYTLDLPLVYQNGSYIVYQNRSYAVGS